MRTAKTNQGKLHTELVNAGLPIINGGIRQDGEIIWDRELTEGETQLAESIISNFNPVEISVDKNVILADNDDIAIITFNNGNPNETVYFTINGEQDSMTLDANGVGLYGIKTGDIGTLVVVVYDKTVKVKAV